MTWNLWLDDQASDPDAPLRHTPEGFLAAESTHEAVKLLEAQGLPAFMDLDHDLGEHDTVRKFLNIMVVMFPDGPVPEYRIHSENAAARPGIVSFLESWKKVIEQTKAEEEAKKQDLVFTVPAECLPKIAVFQRQHRQIHGSYAGAIGGRFSYKFTPTGLGTIIHCECACGDHLDVTDYDGW